MNSFFSFLVPLRGRNLPNLFKSDSILSKILERFYPAKCPICQKYVEFTLFSLSNRDYRTFRYCRTCQKCQSIGQDEVLRKQKDRQMMPAFILFVRWLLSLSGSFLSGSLRSLGLSLCCSLSSLLLSHFLSDSLVDFLLSL